MTTTPVPFTLRTAAGLSDTPPRLEESAIVVIDAQQEYGKGGVLSLPDLAPAMDRIEQLLIAARTRGGTIIHVMHDGKPGGLFDPAAGGQVLTSAAPGDGEVVVHKTLPNAFAGTDLAERLTELGDPPLILVGFMTHMCVSSTARAALDLGRPVTVVADASATRALPAHGADVPISAGQLHQAALAALADRFGAVVDAAALL